MIDINDVRNKTDMVKEALLKRGLQVDFTQFLEWDKERRGLLTETENLKAEKNRVSDKIPVLKKQKKDIKTVIDDMKKISETIKETDKKVEELGIKIEKFLSELPNIPDEDVLPGGKENNSVISEWGKKPEFDFKTKNHIELVEDLGLIDYKRGSKLGGNGFWIYKGNGALLEWSLLNYFIEEHLKDGYEFILPPHILLYRCGYTAGQFPKFEEDVFRLAGAEDTAHSRFILPTAETALVNIHSDEIMDSDELPRKYFAYTPCYRKEAGSYRSGERGMIRGHQFNKVEMVQYALPEKSDSAFRELVEKAERLVSGLGLHYRVSKLAAGDCSASMAKTYDIEVWIPSMNEYKEISSVSNARDYQARRGNIRFKRKGAKKTEFVHTLNASGLATSRLIPAIAEQFQKEDGSVIVPEVLRKWMGLELLD